ncbi:MAG TPA: PIN domain-containing protein [Desulfotomaculum sp.]|nr:PIN domain-containing protein [Desulfotomaculum sp.]
MICYLDTSALVKLYVDENGSDAVRELVNKSLIVATCKVAYTEARAALARGFREGALEEKGYRLALSAFLHDWHSYLSVEVSDSLMNLAGDLTEKHPLRGFDAIHAAAVLTLNQRVREPIVVACWDVRLWDAVRAYDLETVPEARPS